MGRWTDLQQRAVLQLEPSRAGATILNVIMFVLTATAAAAVFVYVADAWPASWWAPENGPSDRVLLGVGALLTLFACVAFVSAFYNGSRWRTARSIKRASDDPALAGLMPTHDTVVTKQHPVAPPPLDVQFVQPGKMAKPPKPLRRLTSQTNVIGRRPLHIVYLRLFDNQPRIRTFLESSWREFGYVYLLRSATAVTRREFRNARELDSIAGLFVADDRAFEQTLREFPTEPNPRGRHRFGNIAPTIVRTRDRYGSYPVRAVLCHGAYWRRAIDILLDRADLVVVDLSGFTERNAGTAYELQRVIDAVPIERVVILRDDRSNKKFLQDAIRGAWGQMSVDSPNAVGGQRGVIVAATDRFQSTQSRQDSQAEQVRLISQRRPSRRLVAAAQRSVEAFESRAITR